MAQLCERHRLLCPNVHRAAEIDLRRDTKDDARFLQSALTVQVSYENAAVWRMVVCAKMKISPSIKQKYQEKYVFQLI